MADPPATAQKTSSFGFLTRKIGPVPIWLIGVAGVGIYWYLSHRKPAATPARVVAGPPGARGPAGARGKAGRTGKTGPPDDRDASGKVTVPNVVGQRYSTGAERIRDSGLIAQRSSPYVGTVRSETPHAGTKLDRGDVVTLRGKPWPPPARGEQPQASQPAMVAAPMTGADVYGTLPTAMPDGSTYDSGQPFTPELGAPYAAAG